MRFTPLLLTPVLATAATLAHSRVQFKLAVALPYDQAFPLFGAWNEQKWADGWKPEFLHPLPPVDAEGAVFAIDHPGGKRAIWMATRFDQPAGQIQYVYVLEGLLITRIDLALKPLDPNHTQVEVTYERTALTLEGERHVNTMASHDRQAGPEWQAALDRYAKKKN